LTNKKVEKMRVLIEMRLPKGVRGSFALQQASSIVVPSLELDTSYEPVPISPHPTAVDKLASAGEETIIVRGQIDEDKIKELESQPNVVKVWKDTKIEAFSCPIPPCDCAPTVAKGTLADVANYLGANQIWAKGIKGNGIVVGVCDTGVDKTKIAAYIGGWSPNSSFPPGTDPGGHGSMCATDVLGIAPDAKIYDLGVLKSFSGITGAVSDAIAGYQWAINQYQVNKTPQILTNSWGIFNPADDPTYANADPNHPFIRKLIEVLNYGILVLFAAGNCGEKCPDSRCPAGTGVGPGKSIWGANGHPRVMTVGAVNVKEEFVGYSSQGPAAADPNKPDFCSITHFKGFTACDNGTSAATPVAAGLVALLKCAKPQLTQDEAKNALKKTAKDIGPTGWDQHSGAGIIQGHAAYKKILATEWTWFYDWGCDGSYNQAVLTLNDDSTFADSQGHTGKWVRVEGMIILQFDTVKTTYAGNVAGSAMVGLMSTFGGLNGCWYAIKQTSTLVLATEIKAELDVTGKKIKPI
jgi:serine protease AprX